MANAFQFRSLLGMGPNGSNSDKKAYSAEDTSNEALRSKARPSRTLQVRENLDVLMRQIEHARHDADQMMEEMSALEIDAGQAASLRRENGTLREKLDESARETLAEASKAESAVREVSRLKDELDRIRDDYEKSQREANANALDAQRIEERLHTAMAALDQAKLDIEIQREAKEKAEVDAACLRANLSERDKSQASLMQAETELRMQTMKLQAQNDELTDELARKERSVLEKTSELENTKDRISNLEGEADASRDEIRALNNKYSDLKVSQESRVFSLNNGLDQERESHRMTRKLLEEARASNDMLTDDQSLLKDQALSSTKETQKYKRELNASRSQIHEYGDRLKDAHLQLSAAQGDIARLEEALQDAKKDAVTMRRQANKADQLLRENSDLHDKMKGLQQRLERYRGKDLIEDIPIMLSSTKRTSPAPKSAPATKKTKANAVAGPTPNVARIRRR